MKIYLTILLIFVPSIYFGYMGQTVEMGLAIVAGAVTSAFINLDKFERFSGAGFEAELRKAVNEAYATLDNLKEVSKPLMKVTLTNLTYSNRWGGMDFKEKHEYKNAIENISKSLEINDELKITYEIFHRYHTWDLYSEFVDVLYKETNNHELRNKLNSIKDYSTENFPNKEEIIEIIATNDSVLTTNMVDKLQTYLYYLKNRKLQESA
ncbi:hypothetical protein [Bacillus sp. B-jedd]|uniref:hypothetical protein n=1 Tax=Bacillus sp. B-jedd TaxID=1476857 RepID=UPI0005155B8F|nr:hypothetical protein [Bacillus sp. B-jedd]CEG25675.1 hypothetical protein BN1002_00491 [Bacillus sp. B-jedd]